MWVDIICPLQAVCLYTVVYWLAKFKAHLPLLVLTSLLRGVNEAFHEILSLLIRACVQVYFSCLGIP